MQNFVDKLVSRLLRVTQLLSIVLLASDVNVYALAFVL